MIMDSSGILILDNFYPDLDWLEVHLSTHLPSRRAQANYPGVTYSAPKSQVEYACEKFNKLIGLKTLPLEINGEVRLVDSADVGTHRTFVHVDFFLTMLIYLDGEEGDEWGTVFYRHKEFGCETYPANGLMKSKMDLVLPLDTNSLERWEVVQRVGFKRNRAVIFPGNRFHSMPQAIAGGGIQRPRITQNFFFNEDPGLL